VAEERGQHRRSGFSELHNTSNGDHRQRVDVRGGGDEHGGDGDKRGSDADRESRTGGANDHNAACQPDSDRRTDGDVRGSGGRDSAARLPVAEECSQHLRGHLSQLYDSSNDDHRQRIDVRGGGDEHGGDGDKRGSDADRESRTGGANDYDATGEPDSDGGANSHV
jgi:hypothetical protein